MLNQKTNYPNYSRSLLFELQCYNDKRTKSCSPRLISLIYLKIYFYETSLSIHWVRQTETRSMGNNPFMHHIDSYLSRKLEN